jgi:hypothetical protein
MNVLLRRQTTITVKLAVTNADPEYTALLISKPVIRHDPEPV